jgi:ATP-dependent protease HslVU (ClpYQ) peptidase subunit
MTTIAAIQGSSWVVIGYDSQVSESEGRKYNLPDNSPKFFEVGKYLIGVAGDYRAVNILSFLFFPPDLQEDITGKDLDKFMISKFVPSLKKCFEANSYGKDEEHGSLIMVIVNSTAYEIGSNYDCIRDSKGLYALGSGGSYALGALYGLFEVGPRRTLKNAKEAMKIALDTAVTLDSGTSYPVYTIVCR